MTDVLGICTAWGDGVCVVEPDGTGDRTRSRSRSPTSSPASRCRRGPRPGCGSARPTRSAGRMTLFPGLETEALGDWTLRRSTEHDARRANSVLAMAPSGLPDDAAYDAAVAFYAARGARPIAAVLPGLGRGGAVPRPRLGARSRTTPTPSSSWPAVASARPAASARCTRTPCSTRTATWSPCGIGDRASGVAALDGDWVGFRAHRGRPRAPAPGPRPGGDGRAARVGRRARRDHGVPPGARRQRARPGALRPARLRRRTTATATSRAEPAGGP